MTDGKVNFMKFISMATMVVPLRHFTLNPFFRLTHCPPTAELRLKFASNAKHIDRPKTLSAVCFKKKVVCRVKFLNILLFFCVNFVSIICNFVYGEWEKKYYLQS